jgi:hypothetical protein
LEKKEKKRVANQLHHDKNAHIPGLFLLISEYLILTPE